MTAPKGGGEVDALPQASRDAGRGLDFGVVDYLAVPPRMDIALSFDGTAPRLDGGAPHGYQGKLSVIEFGTLLRRFRLL